MKLKPQHSLPFLTSLLILFFLVQMTMANPPSLSLLPTAVLFGVLMVFTMTFAVILGGGPVSMTSMTILAAYLVLGPIPAAWAAFWAALIHAIIRYSWAEEMAQPLDHGLWPHLSEAFAQAGMQALCILAAGSIYQNAGGSVPLTNLEIGDLFALTFLAVSYLSVSRLLNGGYLALFGREKLEIYLQSLPKIVLFEAYTFTFAPLVALIYSRLGLAVFVIFAFAIVLSSLAISNLASARQRLERRIKELDSLQAVGRALSGSLDLGTILPAIHAQVATLMPADNFYIALLDPQSNEISFPLEIEEGKRAQLRSHHKGSELTEYILRTQRPLLIRRGRPFDNSLLKVEGLKVEGLGPSTGPGAGVEGRESFDAAQSRPVEGVSIGNKNPCSTRGVELDPVERPPASFLGVPLVAGQESLGVIAVQSYTTPGLYDESHREVLITLAAQAAVAIQNARLYSHTDKALANRVQELDSILRTTKEGILLFDVHWKVLAANRTLAELLGISQAVITGSSLGSRREDNGGGLMNILGYTAEGLRADCHDLSQGTCESKKQTLIIPRYRERHLERTLTPVRDRSGEVSGYLMVIRDLTEERQLAKMRDEMTHMLIHDLRSPLSTLQGALNVVDENLAEGNVEAAKQLVTIAQHSSEKMLRLIDDLLDISQLEGDRIPLQLEAIEVEEMLEAMAEQVAPLAEQAQISVAVEVDPDLPAVRVDAEYFERVLNNLIDNAYKFTPDGGSIRIWARKANQNGSAGVLIGVSDDGPGIPKEDQNRLFKKFQQVISNKGRRTGTGLGLVYCKLVVEAHGGKIWVESEPGKGSTFMVKLVATA
jgi:signal transduction histidine kinase